MDSSSTSGTAPRSRSRSSRRRANQGRASSAIRVGGGSVIRPRSAIPSSARDSRATHGDLLRRRAGAPARPESTSSRTSRVRPPARPRAAEALGAARLRPTVSTTSASSATRWAVPAWSVPMKCHRDAETGSSARSLAKLLDVVLAEVRDARRRRARSSRGRSSRPRRAGRRRVAPGAVGRRALDRRRGSSRGSSARRRSDPAWRSRRRETEPGEALPRGGGRSPPAVEPPRPHVHARGAARGGGAASSSGSPGCPDPPRHRTRPARVLPRRSRTPSPSSSCSSDGSGRRLAGADGLLEQPREPALEAVVRPTAPILSNPAATTVTRTSSPSASSTTAPKMMFASGCATRVIASAAMLTSCSVRSVGPAIDSSTPFAPSIEDSSSGWRSRTSRPPRRGPSPEPIPMPIERRAGARHDRLHVGEVEVDQPRRRDQRRDAVDPLIQDLVGHPERIDHRHGRVRRPGAAGRSARRSTCRPPSSAR